MTEATSPHLQRPPRTLSEAAAQLVAAADAWAEQVNRQPNNTSYADITHSDLLDERARLETCMGGLEQLLEIVRVQAVETRVDDPFVWLGGQLQDLMGDLRPWLDRVSDAERGGE